MLLNNSVANDGKIRSLARADHTGSRASVLTAAGRCHTADGYWVPVERAQCYPKFNPANRPLLRDHACIQKQWAISVKIHQPADSAGQDDTQITMSLPGPIPAGSCPPG